MKDKMEDNHNIFLKWLSENDWGVFSEKAIDHGRQLVVTDGENRCPINFYNTGTIVVGGKGSELKEKLIEWVNIQQSGIRVEDPEREEARFRNRIAKYLINPDKVESTKADILSNFSGDISERDPSGAAELYRLECRRNRDRITITQYQSGTLMVQGLSSILFDEICEALDRDLMQSFSEKAARYIPCDEEERVRAENFLDRVEAENEAASWLHERLNITVIGFCYPNDKETLYAAAGVHNVVQQLGLKLPDYSVVVMPFAKAYEGFLIRLAVHLEVANEDEVRAKANEIEIGNWINQIEKRITDKRRYRESCTALKAAWECRHKAIHSDPEHPYSVLSTLLEAETEVSIILRAMSRAYRVFCKVGFLTSKQSGSDDKKSEVNKYRYLGVDRDVLRGELVKDGYNVDVQASGRKNVWEILNPPELVIIAPSSEEGLIVIEGEEAPVVISHYRILLENKISNVATDADVKRSSWIGVDESGKGDLFGPLVIAGVVLTSEIEMDLAKCGVKDSKALSDQKILDLAVKIKAACGFEVITLLPPEYNIAYIDHNRNLNYLLAWGHAEVISRLYLRTMTQTAISDQFGDERLILQELETRGLQINLEQRHHAEDDLAVAAASILARAAFIEAIDDYSIKSGIKIPLGSSSPDVEKVAKEIYRKWGKKGLARIAKMHFKTAKRIIN